MLAPLMKVLCGTSATAATAGRVRLAVLLAIPTASASILLTSIRRITTIVTPVSPSAASTQVVPNGGKCGMIEVCLGG